MSKERDKGDALRRARKETTDLAKSEARRGLDDTHREENDLARAEARRAEADAKRAKAEAKRAKAEAKYRAKETEAREKARVEALKILTEAQVPSVARFPEGVELGLREASGGKDLVVRGLTAGQIERVAREVGRDVEIVVNAEGRPVRAALLRFVREGLFQTIVKIIAGLIVGYLLMRFGLR